MKIMNHNVNSLRSRFPVLKVEAYRQDVAVAAFGGVDSAPLEGVDPGLWINRINRKRTQKLCYAPNTL
jgi:hypothetical protein